MIVREANEDDLDWIIVELTEFTNTVENKKSLRGPDEYWRIGLLNLINNHVFFIAETYNREKAGLIAGVFINHLFNPDIKVLSETFWWVSEKFRKTRAGLLLLNKFVSFGKENADWVLMSLESKSPVNEKCLTKRGFLLQERNYILEN